MWMWDSVLSFITWRYSWASLVSFFHHHRRIRHWTLGLKHGSYSELYQEELISEDLCSVCCGWARREHWSWGAIHSMDKNEKILFATDDLRHVSISEQQGWLDQESSSVRGRTQNLDGSDVLSAARPSNGNSCSERKCKNKGCTDVWACIGVLISEYEHTVIAVAWMVGLRCFDTCRPLFHLGTLARNISSPEQSVFASELWGMR